MRKIADLAALLDFCRRLLYPVLTGKNEVNDMELYVIRHGESEANYARRYSGWWNVNLTEKGRADAANAGRVLAGVQFDRIYSSDLNRAIQTAKIALPGCEPEQTAQIREIHVGDLAGRLYEDVIANGGEEFQKNWAARDFSPYNGESHQQHVRRVTEFMQQFERDDNETIAVFCHAGVLRCMLQYVIGGNVTAVKAQVHNGAVCRFRWTEGTWQLVTWNQV